MALVVDNVTAGYGPIIVLRGISLSVEPGEIRSEERRVGKECRL